MAKRKTDTEVPATDVPPAGKPDRTRKLPPAYLMRQNSPGQETGDSEAEPPTWVFLGGAYASDKEAREAIREPGVYRIVWIREDAEAAQESKLTLTTKRPA